MKKVYKAISLMFTFTIVINFIFLGGMKVNAQDHGGGGSVDSDTAFQHSISGYFMTDSTSIPTGNHFFYRYDTGKVWYCTLNECIALLSNKSYGISMDSGTLGALANGFMNYAANYTAGILHGGISDRAVWKGDPSNGGGIVGYALNSIEGCEVVRPNSNSDYTIDSSINNFINIYVMDYIENLPLDYINVIGLSKSFCPTTNDLYRSYEYLIALRADTQYNPASYVMQYPGSNNKFAVNVPADVGFYMTASNFDALVSALGLTKDNNTFNERDFEGLNSSVNGSYSALFYKEGEQYRSRDCYCLDNFDNSVVVNDVGSILILGTANNNIFWTYTTLFDGQITVYRDTNIIRKVENNIYAPSVNTSTQTNNYNNSSTSNSVNTTTNETNNSTTNNTNIYNDQSEKYYDNSYYNSENHYNIDNSVVETNNTTIINNYYGSTGGGDDNGGGDNGGDDDDDLIWNAMLKAIIDFFKKIGELIAALITGILGLFTQVLDALAQITTNFTSLTNFFSSILGFLPTEMITVLTAALALVLLCCIIRIFRR